MYRKLIVLVSTVVICLSFTQAIAQTSTWGLVEKEDVETLRQESTCKEPNWSIINKGLQDGRQAVRLRALYTWRAWGKSGPLTQAGLEATDKVIDMIHDRSYPAGWFSINEARLLHSLVEIVDRNGKITQLKDKLSATQKMGLYLALLKYEFDDFLENIRPSGTHHPVDSGPCF